MFVMIVGTKTPLFTQGQFIAAIFVIILLYSVKMHGEQSAISSTMCLFHSQAVAQDNNAQLSTQLQQVTGLLGINMSQSEARKKRTERWKRTPAVIHYFCFMHTCIYSRPCCCI